MPFRVVYFSNSWEVHFSDQGWFGYSLCLLRGPRLHVGVGLFPGFHILVAIELLHGRRLELGMAWFHGRRFEFAHRIL